MPFYFIFILLILVIVFFGGHWFVWHTLVNFFSINNQALRHWLLIVILFLGLAFVLSMWLIRLSSNSITHWFYTIATVWVGLFINLFIASLIIWLSQGIIKLTGSHFNLLPLALLLFIAALAWSIYSIANAFNPQIKEVDVTLNNLPPAWSGKTIVQLSDLHLGAINKTRFLKDIVTRTNNLSPDLIVITGDLFDGIDGDENIFVPLLNQLQASEGVFFVTGNHDYYLGKDEVLKVLGQTKIQVLQDQMQVINGLQIVGLDYGNFNGRSDLAAVLTKIHFSKDQASILLYHAPIGLDVVKDSGINLQLSGHTHRGQIFPLNLLTKFIYHGYDYGLFHEGNFWLYVSSGVGTWGPPMRSGSNSEIVKIKLQ